jgi:hypothetical protein
LIGSHDFSWHGKYRIRAGPHQVLAVGRRFRIRYEHTILRYLF